MSCRSISFLLLVYFRCFLNNFFFDISSQRSLLFARYRHSLRLIPRDFKSSLTVSAHLFFGLHWARLPFLNSEKATIVGELWQRSFYFSPSQSADSDHILNVDGLSFCKDIFVRCPCKSSTRILQFSGWISSSAGGSCWASCCAFVGEFRFLRSKEVYWARLFHIFLI